MKQASMFENDIFSPGEEKVFQLLKQPLADICEARWFDSKIVIFSLRPLKGSQYSSITLKNENNLICRLRMRGKSPYVEIPKKYSHLISSIIAVCPRDKDSPYVRMPLSGGWSTCYTELIAHVLDNSFDEYPCDFACCHLYTECSDAMRCLHPNDLFYLDCSYRKKLYRGIVFYGKNANQ